MTGLLLAALVFVGSHFLLSSRPVRAPLAAGLGEQRFIAGYSLLSGAALLWLLWGYAEAPFIALWSPSAVMRYLPLVVMPAALVLIAAALRGDNPTAVGADPSRMPAGGLGIFAITRHPLMWGLGLWALSHIPPNGDAASLVFFGAFAVLALVGTLALDAKQRARHPDGFRELAAKTSNLPFAALLARRTRLAPALLMRPAAIGLALYGLLLLLHPWLFGASPLPG